MQRGGQETREKGLNRTKNCSRRVTYEFGIDGDGVRR